MKTRLNIPPKIFIIGPPAAGKTTARTIILSWFAKRGQNLVVLGMDIAHRTLLPPENSDGTYYYDNEGALVLRDPDRQVKEALGLLIKQCRDAFNAQEGYVVELPHREIKQALAEFSKELIQGSLIIYITANVSIRIERNKQRGTTRVPEHIIQTYFYPDKLPEELTSSFSHLEIELVTVSSDETLEQFQNQIESLMSIYI